jgi:hypothetical protein
MRGRILKKGVGELREMGEYGNGLVNSFRLFTLVVIIILLLCI